MCTMIERFECLVGLHTRINCGYGGCCGEGFELDSMRSVYLCEGEARQDDGWAYLGITDSKACRMKCATVQNCTYYRYWPTGSCTLRSSCDISKESNSSVQTLMCRRVQRRVLGDPFDKKTLIDGPKQPSSSFFSKESKGTPADKILYHFNSYQC